MKIDKRKGKRIQKPFCESSHAFGDFIPHGNNGLIKRCNNCPATQTRDEYLKLKINHFVKPERTVIKMSHVDLFQF